MSQLALLGGSPIRTKGFARQNTIGAAEKTAVMEVLDSGVLSKFLGEYDPDFYGGPRVKALESAFATRFGARHAVSTNSATTALQVSVAATGLGPGDEVIVSPYTMSASATAILHQHAVPVFADVLPGTFCLDPASIRARISPSTRAIMVVHIFGQPADMKPILEIAKEHGLAIIEDSAQAIGATYDGQYAGTFGDAGVFSLNYHKIIHSGEGGVVLCRDDVVAERARMVRNHGECIVEAIGWSDISNTMGSNYRMTEIEAAIASVQLSRLDHLLECRQQLAARLSARLGAFGPAIKPPEVHPLATHAYYVYAVRLDPDTLQVSRHTFVEALAAEGIPFGEGYVRPLYLLPLFQRRTVYPRTQCPWSCPEYTGSVSYDRGLCPVAERLHEQELILADLCHDPLTPEDMDDVTDAFEKILSNLDALREWEHGKTRSTSEDPGSRAGRWRR